MFPAGDWPLHITIVPPFETELDAEAVAGLLPRAPRIPLVASGHAMFGSRRSVEVTLFEPSEALIAAHRATVDALEAAGARIPDQRHLRDGYRPHATVQRSGSLKSGDRVTVDALTLVDRAPAGLRGARHVVARVPLAP